MKIEWKILCLSMIGSAILTGTVVIFLLTYTTPYRLAEPQAFLMKEIIINVLDSQLYVPYWMVMVISLSLFVVLSIVFYFLIGYLRKRKK